MLRTNSRLLPHLLPRNPVHLHHLRPLTTPTPTPTPQPTASTPASTINPTRQPKDNAKITPPNLADNLDTSETPTISRLNILESPKRARLFTSIGNTSFTIGDIKVEGPLIVLGQKEIMWDVPQYGVGGPDGAGAGAVSSGTDVERWDDPSSPFHGWTTDVFKVLELLDELPEILVIGTGARMAMLPPFIRKYLHSLGLQVEIQATRAAGSTYNVLLTEGRRPGAALLPVIPTSARTSQMLVKLNRTSSSPNVYG